MNTTLSNFNLSSAYKLADLRQLCQRITSVLTPVPLAGHRLTVHDLHPHQLSTDYTVREHVHSFYEGHIVLEGSAMYTVGVPQPLGPGSALLHAPHTPHTWQTSDDTCLRLLFWFSLEPVVQTLEIIWPTWPDMLWDVALLMREAQAMEPGWQQRVNARVVLLVSRLCSMANWPATTAPDETHEPTLLESVEQFMRDNLMRSLTLEDIAGHIGVSTRSLCRQFQQLAGVTVMERLFTLRMERAAGLLTSTDAKLAVIAEQTGLPEPSHFCRCFRKYYHLTPKEYRKQNS